MGRHMLTAYDRNNNELWISSDNIGEEPGIRTDYASDVINICETVKTGKIIDSRTGLPVVQHHDPETNKPAQISKRIAYFRIYDNQSIWSIYITEYGRKAGIRNYETRRPDDTESAQIIGYPPIRDSRIEVTYHNDLDLIIGEGEAREPIIHGKQRNIDRWGDPVVLIATCNKISLEDSDYLWQGYTYVNHLTSEIYALENATRAYVRKYLKNVAREMITKYGDDITKW